MKVLIIDDDKLVSLSLKTILEASGKIEIVGIGDSGSAAIELYETLKPDILLMDIRMDGMTGLDAGAHILSSHPEAKILFLTTFSDDEYIVKALKIGAKGYILKQNFDSIVPALLAIGNGQNVFGDEITGKLPALMNLSPEMKNFESYDISKRIYAPVSRG